jgi:hypothetical protein
VKINGSTEAPLECSFSCLSQGPVTQISQKEIDWGLTPLLQDSTREINITNESLIIANYSARMVKTKNQKNSLNEN